MNEAATNDAAKSQSSTSEKDNLVGYQLLETYNLYVRLLTQRTHSGLMQLNLTQWRTLTYIRFNPDQTQSSLSKSVRIDPSSMTPIIDFFERKRWVKRHKSPANRSAYGIRLTAKGAQAYAKIEEEINNTELMFQELLNETGYKQVCMQLRKLSAAMEAQLD